MFVAVELNAIAKSLWCAILTAVTKPSSIETHNAGQRLDFRNAWCCMDVAIKELQAQFAAPSWCSGYCPVCCCLHRYPTAAVKRCFELQDIANVMHAQTALGKCQRT